MLTDIRYRESKIMAGSGDKKDSKDDAATVSGGGVVVISGRGEKYAKDTVSGDATMGRDIDGGASNNVCNEIKGEKGGVVLLIKLEVRVEVRILLVVKVQLLVLVWIMVEVLTMVEVVELVLVL